MPYFPYNRRQFIKTCVATASGLFLSKGITKSFATVLTKERRLQCYNIHTGDRIDVCYWINGNYDNDALGVINYFFRDFRTGDVKTINTRLLDFLHDICEKAPGKNVLNLVSGYRSPETNRMLSARSSGVSRKSLHMMGHAADIRLPGLKTTTLRKIAVNLGIGGVGYYPESDFVHVDIGHVRHW